MKKSQFIRQGSFTPEISYEFAKRDLEEGRATRPESKVAVRLSGKVVGAISQVDGGYQYCTNNFDLGETFPTFLACCKSLEV